MYGYVLLPQAVADLEEIAEFLSAASPDFADRILNEIQMAIQRLIPFPYQGHRRPDLTSRPLRFKPVNGYLIAYAPDECPLLVVAIVHGSRSPRVLAAILRGRPSIQ